MAPGMAGARRAACVAALAGWLSLAPASAWSSASSGVGAAVRHPLPCRTALGSSRRLRVVRASWEDDQEPDFITKVFGRFLPKPEDMGLKRLSVETAPEQFPCTKKRWAEPVDGDDEDVALIRPALAQTRFETRPLQLCYDAERDGWSAEAFHAKLDRQGPGVVLCRTESGWVGGGYNPKGWVNYAEFRGSLAAFLFTWPDGDTSVNPIKLQKVGGAGLAQVDDGTGPKFGMMDLACPLAGSNPKRVVSKLGSYYERMPDESNSMIQMGGKKLSEDQLVSLKVYIGVYGPDEYIPFTDAEPFALN